MADLAIEIAAASASVNSEKVQLDPLAKIVDDYKTPFTIDPFELSLSEKNDLLLSWEDLIHKNEAVTSSSTFLDFRRIIKHFQATNGSKITQTLLQAGAGITCGIVKGHRERYERSFPTSSGQFVTGGYEVIKSFKIEDNIERIASEALALQQAQDCPSGEMTVILSPDLASLQIHESIGHPLELDRVFGSERNFSGTSFATTDKLGKLQYASGIISVYSDPTYTGGLSTYGYDDEGVKAERVPLIEKGILVGYLSSRETAKRIGRPSSAAARAEGWENVPLVRITNIILEPGDKKFADMLSEVDNGIYIEGTSTWSIDDNREDFNLGGEIGWEIKNGKLGAMIKSPTYSGSTVEFWNKCDSVGHKDEWVLWGTPNCGKGEPGQNARTAQGAAYLRFQNVKVGA
jgi:TldD protein